MSTSNPTLNIWCAHTTQPNKPILTIAYTIPSSPNTSFLPEFAEIMCEIIPKAGKIKIYTSGWPKNQNRC